MVLKLILVIVAIAFLVALGVRTVVYQPSRTIAVVQGNDSVVGLARRQKAIGQTKGTVSEVRMDYAGSSIDLAEALKTYSVVVAERIDSKSLALGQRDIQTWSKSRIGDPCTKELPAMLNLFSYF